jgi:hypothetical protein
MFGLVDSDPVPAQAAGEALVGNVGQPLGFGELRGAFQRPHFPGDLVEVVVVQS